MSGIADCFKAIFRSKYAYAYKMAPSVRSAYRLLTKQESGKVHELIERTAV